MNSIKLNVIKYKKNRYFYFFRFCVVLYFVYLLGLILSIFLASDSNTDGMEYRIALYWLLVLMLLAIMKSTYYVCGVINIDQEFLYLDFQDEKMRLVDLQNLEITITGYRFQPKYTVRTVVLNSGIDNQISFWHENQRYTYNFLIKNRRELKKIETFFNKS